MPIFKPGADPVVERAGMADPAVQKWKDVVLQSMELTEEDLEHAEVAKYLAMVDADMQMAAGHMRRAVRGFLADFWGFLWKDEYWRLQEDRED